MFTKRQLVEKAFSIIGLQPSIWNVDADMLQDAVSTMDGMLAVWNEKGIRLGYALSSSPDTVDIEVASGLPDRANAAVYLNLAMQLASTVGKQISAETRTAAREAYRALLNRAAQPQEQQQPVTMPVGIGNRHRSHITENPFFPPPVDPLLAGQDGPIEFT